jgi:hypothetical protein
MILPTDEECVAIIEALADEPNLTAWEQDFLEDNADREHFTPAQKEAVANLREKYDV